MSEEWEIWDNVWHFISGVTSVERLHTVLWLCRQQITLWWLICFVVLFVFSRFESSLRGRQVMPFYTNVEGWISYHYLCWIWNRMSKYSLNTQFSEMYIKYAGYFEILQYLENSKQKLSKSVSWRNALCSEPRQNVWVQWHLILRVCWLIIVLQLCRSRW